MSNISNSHQRLLHAKMQNKDLPAHALTPRKAVSQTNRSTAQQSDTNELHFPLLLVTDTTASPTQQPTKPRHGGRCISVASSTCIVPPSSQRTSPRASARPVGCTCSSSTSSPSCSEPSQSLVGLFSVTGGRQVWGCEAGLVPEEAATVACRLARSLR
jgi:hypothetical protein